VDGNADTSRAMTKLIRLLGHDAVIAHGGPEAIVLATDCRPEHAHLAIGLPGMDGPEVASPLQRTVASQLVGKKPTHEETRCNIPGGSSVL
jgi:CheY-like chemotaxis protein